MLDKIEEIGKAEPTAAGQVMPQYPREGLQLHFLSDAVCNACAIY